MSNASLYFTCLRITLIINILFSLKIVSTQLVGVVMPNLRIAIFHMGFMYSGGGERTAIYENLSLKKKGHNVACFAPTVRPSVCHPDLIKKIDLKGFLPKVKFPLPLRDFLSLALSSFLVPFYIHKFADFDIILCHGQPATWIGYCVAKTFGKPYVCYLHQPARFLYPRPIDLEVGWKIKRDFAILNHLVNTAKPLVKTWDRVSVTSADALLVNSKWTSKLVQKIYSSTPMVCPPGVDTQRYRPSSSQTKLTINNKTIRKPFILSTNRHYPQKGLEYLIAMMPKILNNCDANLVLTSLFTKYTPKIKKLAKNLKIEDKVLFTNQVGETDLIKLYQNADVYVYSSPCEDFGLGPIEAMACGTPAVVWDYAGPTETVVNGLTGFRAKPYSIDDFADKVLRLLTDENLNQKMGKNAVNFVREFYSWNKHMKILESVLSSLA